MHKIIFKEIEGNLLYQQEPRGDGQNFHDNRIIPVNYRSISQQSHPIDVKDFFNEKRAVQNNGKIVSESCGNGDQAVLQRMMGKHLVKERSLAIAVRT